MSPVLAGLLYLAPALLIAAALLRGSYPGERTLAAVVARARAARRPRAERRRGRARAVAAIVPRGGDLVAARLAGRAPPHGRHPHPVAPSLQGALHTMRTRTLLAASAALVAVAAVPTAAQAHVTVNPQAVPADGYQVLSVRVPNEDDRAATTKVRLRFPSGFASVSYEAQAGWRAKVVKRRLARPIETGHGPVTEEVASVTWTGTRRGLGRIAPGQFREFRISTKIPAGRAGTRLTFGALQTYSDGEIVRWTGAPDSDRPAPQLTLTAAARAHGSRAATAPSARAAHAGVVRRTPAPGTTVSDVKAVGLVFSQRLVTGKLDIYRGSTKLTPRSSGPDGSRVRATFARKLAAGGYTVRWRAVAADGHTQTGSWSFRVR